MRIELETVAELEQFDKYCVKRGIEALKAQTVAAPPQETIKEPQEYRPDTEEKQSQEEHTNLGFPAKWAVKAKEFIKEQIEFRYKSLPGNEKATPQQKKAFSEWAQRQGVTISKGHRNELIFHPKQKVITKSKVMA